MSPISGQTVEGGQSQRRARNRFESRDNPLSTHIFDFVDVQEVTHCQTP